MKASSFIAADVGGGALYQARTFTVTTKTDIRRRAFTSFKASLNCQRNTNTLTAYCVFCHPTGAMHHTWSHKLDTQYGLTSEKNNHQL